VQPFIDLIEKLNRRRSILNIAPHFSNADRYYPKLVALVVVSALAMLGWQIFACMDAAADLRSYLGSRNNALAVALLVVTAATLVWRLVFALRYKPYAPVEDDRLPPVTVVIPAYNEGSQVLSTVRSIMASCYPLQKMQVICVDDGSQDDTWQWMQQALEEYPRRVQLIRQPTNKGKRAALLAGFAQAVGQVYVTIDSDSEVLPDTLRQVVSPLVHDERIGAVAGNVRVLNLHEGAIPKMMEVSFSCAFDFIRSGQSVYGGVFCTPGALSAFRARMIEPHLDAWADQTFMGKPAAIGEDRALTNIVLASGYRVVYQRHAMVFTKVPIHYAGLRKMLLRWARSNIRENLVMLSFIVGPFRPADSGGYWLRLFSATQLFRMTTGSAFKLAVLIQLMLAPSATLTLLVVGCLFSGIPPAIVYQLRYRRWFGWRWAVCFSFYWLFSLCWIPVWGLLTATQSGWLTRSLPATVPAMELPATRQDIVDCLPRPAVADGGLSA
jgi:hyaluronan synthase